MGSKHASIQLPSDQIALEYFLLNIMGSKHANRTQWGLIYKRTTKCF
jgi:hypothetical protein